MAHAITLIPGDGAGPALTGVTRRVLEATGAAFDRDAPPDTGPGGGAAVAGDYDSEPARDPARPSPTTSSQPPTTPRRSAPSSSPTP